MREKREANELTLNPRGKHAEDSRQSDGSFSDIQETLRVVHLRGSRKQPEEVTKRHRQKKEYLQILMCQSTSSKEPPGSQG
ncbi:hypothetical protein YC2023_061396 [Brassica napus]